MYEWVRRRGRGSRTRREKVYDILRCEPCNYQAPDDGQRRRCVVCKKPMVHKKVAIREGRQVVVG